MNPSKGIGRKEYFQGLVDFVKTLKLRLRIKDLDLPERKTRHTRSREEEDILYEMMCLWGKAMKSNTHTEGECEMHKKARDVLE